MSNHAIIVAFDSNTLIWSMQSLGLEELRRNQSERDKEMVRRAGILIEDLEDGEQTIAISTISLAEILIKVPEARRGDYLAEITQRFTIVDLDIKGAYYASELFKASQLIRREAAGEHHTREAIKSDTYIVGSLKAFGINLLYTNDSNARKLAERAGLKAKDLPDYPTRMFGSTGKRKKKR